MRKSTFSSMIWKLYGSKCQRKCFYFRRLLDKKSIFIMNTNVNFSSKSQSKAISAKKSSILKSLISLFSIKSWWNATARKCCKSFFEIQTNLLSTLLTSLLHWGNNRTPFCPLKIFYLSLDYVYPFLKIMKVIIFYIWIGKLIRQEGRKLPIV